MLESSDYAAMASSLAEVVPASRTIAFLEGGYDLQAIAESAGATVEGSLGIGASEGRLPTEVTGSAGRVTELVVEALSEFWEVR